MKSAFLAAIVASVVGIAGCVPAEVEGDDSEEGADEASLTSSNPCPSTMIPTAFAGGGVETDVNREANDYALIEYDAQNPSCAAAAATVLFAKLKNTLDYAARGGTVRDPRSGLQVHPLRSWLWGTAVTHLYVAALELQRAGIVPPDSLLQQARDAFGQIPSVQDPGCGGASNSCLDDYTLTASGFGWLALYEARRGRLAGPYITRAQAEINGAFTPMSSTTTPGSICIYKIGSSPASCSGTVADLASGQYRVIGADHGQENPAYGAGLLMALGSACAGLYMAGAICTFTATQNQLMQGLVTHAQSKAASDGSSFNAAGANGCMVLSNPSQTTSCADTTIPGGYLPTDFPFKRFYAQKVSNDHPELALPQTGFQFSSYSEPRTTNDRSNFWGANRRSFYQRLGYLLWPPGALPTYPTSTYAPWTALSAPLAQGVEKSGTVVNLRFGKPANATAGEVVTMYVRVFDAAGTQQHAGITGNTWYTLPTNLPAGSYTWDVTAVAVVAGSSARYAQTARQPLSL
jgi:hypothetical protein